MDNIAIASSHLGRFGCSIQPLQLLVSLELRFVGDDGFCVVRALTSSENLFKHGLGVNIMDKEITRPGESVGAIHRRRERLSTADLHHSEQHRGINGQWTAVPAAAC